MQHNAHILALLEAGPFAIEWSYGIEAFANYMDELELLRAGAKYSSLGIGDRRAAARPGVLVLEGKQPRLMEGSEYLRREDETPAGSVALIKLSGVMRAQDGASSRGVASIIDDMNAANQNDNIDGIILEVNTGGGQVLAGHMMNQAVASSSKPVVVHGHLVASAGYMASMNAKAIIASSDAARFGSIGTMMTLPKGFAAYYNAYYTDMYATKSVNKNRSFRQFLEGDMSGMKEKLEATNEEFLAMVRAARSLAGSEKNQDYTLSGAMFDAKAAQRRGLIDGIGGLNTAINQLKKHI